MIEILFSFLFFGVLIIQFFFIIFIFSKLAFYKEPLLSFQYLKNIDIEGITIIIAAHNESKNLRHLIPALLKQNHVKYEIIIINDRSDDDSYKYLAIESKKKNLKYIEVKRTPFGIHPKKYALQKGIEKAQFETLVFTDADCIPLSNDWIIEVQKKIY